MKKIPEIRKQEFLDYYSKGLNDYDIARAMNISDSTTYRWRKSFNLPSNHSRQLSRNKPIAISKEQYEILCGTLLGDSSLEYYPGKGQRSPRFKCEHGIKQKDYAQLLYSKLASLGSHFRENKKIDKRNSKEYISYSICTKSNPNFFEFYNVLYKDNVKVISKEFLTHFTIKSLAYLYMDDGYADQYTAYICTDCFDEISRNTLRDYIKVHFNLHFTVVNHGKYFRLRLKHCDFKRFCDLIKPYMIKSLTYKLNAVS